LLGIHVSVTKDFTLDDKEGESDECIVVDTWRTFRQVQAPILVEAGQEQETADALFAVAERIIRDR
jgi:hypothetical protein